MLKASGVLFWRISWSSYQNPEYNVTESTWSPFKMFYLLKYNFSSNLLSSQAGSYSYKMSRIKFDFSTLGYIQVWRKLDAVVWSECWQNEQWSLSVNCRLGQHFLRQVQIMDTNYIHCQKLNFSLKNVTNFKPVLEYHDQMG